MRVRAAVERTTERTAQHPPGNTAFVMWTLHVVPVSERGVSRDFLPKSTDRNLGSGETAAAQFLPPSSSGTEASDGFLILKCHLVLEQE